LDIWEASGVIIILEQNVDKQFLYIQTRKGVVNNVN